MINDIQFPRQTLSSSRKTKSWGKKCVLWAEARSYENYSPTRKSVRDKQINYDLLNGKLHMGDLAIILNPANISADYIPERIQHFPIMNSKLEVLIGEELKRPFDWRAVVTNPNAISEIERAKNEEMLKELQQIVEDGSLSEEDYEQRLEDLDEKFTFQWQDFRELRANEWLKHYVKEYSMPLMFNDGFKDALAVGEELYEVGISGGEPFIEKKDPRIIRSYRLGRSNKIEDADIIILEEFWNPGKVIDTYYDKLSKQDIDYLERLPEYLSGEMGIPDSRHALVQPTMMDDVFRFEVASKEIFSPYNDPIFSESNLAPYDNDGNIRVLRVLWKSRRLIKKVKQYDPETGEAEYNFYSEEYVPDESKGEEVQELWGNEAWEGTLIGGHNDDFSEHAHDGTYGIFVNIQPRPIQFSRLSNPSKCHLGIIGTVYNIQGEKPFSMVDMMKPYNYLYDVLHHRLSDAIASSWGSLAEVDIDKIPNSWTMDKWLYFAKVNHIAVSSSFNEGQEGAAKGKIAGALNNNTQRIISDASDHYIQQLSNLAEWTKVEMGEIVGINRQREGQIANRETVGGVERATLQSSYITESFFAKHNDTKKRALNAFLEACKISARGKKIKFQYILSDGSMKLMEFDGDEFAEEDYGIIIDSSSDITALDQKIDTLAQAALQNSAASLSDIMRMFTSSSSLAEKIRILQSGEKKRQRQVEREQQMQMQQAQDAMQAQMQQKQAELEFQRMLNTENNETKLLIAQLQGQAKLDSTAMQVSANAEQNPEPMSEEARQKLMEQIREFDIKIQQDNKKLALEKERNSIARSKKNEK